MSIKRNSSFDPVLSWEWEDQPSSSSDFLVDFVEFVDLLEDVSSEYFIVTFFSWGGTCRLVGTCNAVCKGIS